MRHTSGADAARQDDGGIKKKENRKYSKINTRGSHRGPKSNGVALCFAIPPSTLAPFAPPTPTPTPPSTHDPLVSFVFFHSPLAGSFVWLSSTNRITRRVKSVRPSSVQTKKKKETENNSVILVCHCFLFNLKVIILTAYSIKYIMNGGIRR